MSQTNPIRKDVAKDVQWNVEKMYGNWKEWQKEFEKVVKAKWPELTREQASIDNPTSLQKFLARLMEVQCSLETLYTYAHLRHDEDVAEEEGKVGYGQALSLLYQFQEDVSWFSPAFLQLSEEKIAALLASEELVGYRTFLEKIVRMKKYTLSDKEELILAGVDKALEASSKAFGALNNGDLQFAPCKDKEGKEHELTHGTYALYLKSRDRSLRKEAFENLHKAFKEHANTLSELLQGVTEQHVFYHKTRGYKSSLEASLYPREIPVSVYHSLIDAVREKLSYLHEYNELRREALGVEHIYAYDLQVPLVDEVDISFSYEEAAREIIESVAPMGKEYQKIIEGGLLQDGWVDRYENQKKRSGAYSSGCYTSMPYILMNYHGTLQDAKTLAHEAGHSMHSYFSSKEQTYQDHQYPIFLAEVASTFHEELLFQHLYGKAKTAREKAYLINQKIEGIRSTLFRQVLFAEFELQVHTWAEEGVSITPQALQKYYGELVEKYSGNAFVVDDAVCHEWSRIPHFYYNFYVYQYATGISAAQVLAKNVLEKKEDAVEKVQEFLSSGGSKDPVATLQRAGVDVTKPDVVLLLLEEFKDLVNELRKILKEL